MKKSELKRIIREEIQNENFINESGFFKKAPLNESRELLKLNKEFFNHLERAIAVGKKIARENEKDRDAAGDFYGGDGYKYDGQSVGRKLEEVYESLGMDADEIFK